MTFSTCCWKLKYCKYCKNNNNNNNKLLQYKKYLLLILHRGKNLLACRIQPWHSSAPLQWQSLHPARASAHRDGDHNPSTSKHWRFKNGEYAGRSCIIKQGCTANHSFTRWEWWKAPLSQIMTKSLNSFLSSGVIGLSWSAFRNVMRRYVLYGPIVGIWNRTTSLEMAAHMVRLAPLCPGTVKVALYPMRSLPRLLTLQRLKTWCAPAASSKITMKGAPVDFNCMMWQGIITV